MRSSPFTTQNLSLHTPIVFCSSLFQYLPFLQLSKSTLLNRILCLSITIPLRVTHLKPNPKTGPLSASLPLSLTPPPPPRHCLTPLSTSLTLHYSLCLTSPSSSLLPHSPLCLAPSLPHSPSASLPLYSLCLTYPSLFPLLTHPPPPLPLTIPSASLSHLPHFHLTPPSASLPPLPPTPSASLPLHPPPSASNPFCLTSPSLPPLPHSLLPQSPLTPPPFASLPSASLPPHSPHLPHFPPVAQSVERATPREEVPCSFPAVAARSLLVGSVSV